MTPVPGGNPPPGDRPADMHQTLAPLASKRAPHQGLEHQVSSIPADWHTEAAGAAGPSSLVPHLSLDHAALERAVSEGGSLSGGLGPEGSSEGGDGTPRAGGAVAAVGPSLWEEAAPYLRLAAWLALLFAGYGFQRGLCAGGLPYDCDGANAGEVFDALTLLAFLGGGLGWLAGVCDGARFAWLAAPRRFYVWLLYAAVLPAYSAIASIPAMRVSLASVDAWGPAPIALKVVSGVVLVGAIVFHIWLALRTAGAAPRCASCGGLTPAPSRAALAPLAKLPPGSPVASAAASDSGSAGGAGREDSALGRRGSASAALAASLKAFAAKCNQHLKEELSIGDGGAYGGPAASSGGDGDDAAAAAARRSAKRRALALYLLPRAAILVYFVAWFVALPLSGSYSLHLHHYALGWAVACFASFNHPVSGLLLALGTAIFVQGAGAYGFDPIFTYTGDKNTTGCLTQASGGTGQMTCAFWADQPFDIQFCTNSSWIPWYDCSVEWPWPETKVWPRNSTAPGSSLAALAQALSSQAN